MRGTPQGMTAVEETGREVKLPERPEEYLREACLRHGSTMEGREKSFRYLTKSSQKAGVLVSEREQEFWFPCVSRENENCEWVSYFHVVKAFASDVSQCEILFDSGARMIVNCSSRTICLQLKRCRRFLQEINEKG